MMMQPLIGEMPVMIPEQCIQRNENVLFNCATKNAPVTANLPSIKSLNFRWVDVFIFDTARNCAKNKITIKPAEADRINGSHDPLVLDKIGAGVMLITFGINDWKCVVFE